MTHEDKTSKASIPGITGGQFCGRWIVKEGHMRGAPADEVAVIEKVGEEFRLCCEENGECETLQFLKFETQTRTLINRPGERPLRSLALWLPESSKQPCRIFGFRQGGSRSPGNKLAPWESRNDNGTWGAEQEPPLGKGEKA